MRGFFFSRKQPQSVTGHFSPSLSFHFCSTASPTGNLFGLKYQNCILKEITQEITHCSASCWHMTTVAGWRWIMGPSSLLQLVVANVEWLNAAWSSTFNAKLAAVTHVAESQKESQLSITLKESEWFTVWTVISSVNDLFRSPFMHTQNSGISAFSGCFKI